MFGEQIHPTTSESLTVPALVSDLGDSRGVFQVIPALARSGRTIL